MRTYDNLMPSKMPGLLQVLDKNYSAFSSQLPKGKKSASSSALPPAISKWILSPVKLPHQFAVPAPHLHLYFSISGSYLSSGL